MNVSQRSEEDFGESVSDVIRVGSIAIAIYECVSSVSCQLLLSPFANPSPMAVIFSPCLQNTGSGSLNFGEAK